MRNLDAIDWPSLNHAYGSAADVPALLEQISAEVAADREAAFRELHSSIAHQGSVYEATLHALPFLIDLLEQPDHPSGDRVALLVATILAAVNTTAVHYSKPMINPFTRQLVPPPRDLRKRIATEDALLKEIRRIGAAAIPSLLPWLKHPEAYFRSAIAHGLRHFVEGDLGVSAALRHALVAETDPEARATFTRVLGSLPNRPYR
jgi:hypothetical protein